MKKWLIGTAVLAVLLGIGCGVLYVMFLPRPTGERGWVDSPDGRHRAYLSVMEKRQMGGGTRTYYRLEIHMGVPHSDERIKIYSEDISEGLVWNRIDMADLSDVLVWQEKGHYLVFKTGRNEIKVQVPF